MAARFDLEQFNFLYDRVLATPLKNERDDMLQEPSDYDDKPEYGRVVCAGEGRLLEDGTVSPLKVSEGDIIFFGRYSTIKTRVPGKQDYYVLREEDIIGVLKEDGDEKSQEEI